MEAIGNKNNCTLITIFLSKGIPYEMIWTENFRMVDIEINAFDLLFFLISRLT